MDFKRQIDISMFKKGLFLLGPRQVGKTYLIEQFLKAKENVLSYNFNSRATYLRLQRQDSLFSEEIEAALDKHRFLYLFLDEIQKFPELLDDLQVLLDKHKNALIPLITGSSARKLRQKKVNLLPGRIHSAKLFPLSFVELGLLEKNNVGFEALRKVFKEGLLPGVIHTEKPGEELKYYTDIYLKEEIEAEAITRNLAAFAHFLSLAAEELGQLIQYSTLGRDVGLSPPSIKSYYEILEDTLIVHRLDPYLKKARERLFTGHKFYFFDVGVAQALAQKPIDEGRLFENVMILEIIKQLHYQKKKGELYYWRTHGGAEVDLVWESPQGLLACEFKFSSTLHPKDLNGLKSFLEKYSCKEALVVGLFDKARKIDQRIKVLPILDFYNDYLLK